MKSWGVTLSLAALGFGFQYRSYGLFLVAAASSVAFWSLEGTIKRHQMRYYPRMREIEVNRYIQAGEADRAFSAPRMDWSWARADRLLRGVLKDSASPPQPSAASRSYGRAWLLPHVAMPHVITLLMSDNAESIFGDLLTLTIADTFTLLGWGTYVPYDRAP